MDTPEFKNAITPGIMFNFLAPSLSGSNNKGYNGGRMEGNVIWLDYSQPRIYSLVD